MNELMNEIDAEYDGEVRTSTLRMDNRQYRGTLFAYQDAIMFRKSLIAMRGDVALPAYFCLPRAWHSSGGCIFGGRRETVAVRYADERRLPRAAPKRRQLPERPGVIQRGGSHRQPSESIRIRGSCRRALPPRVCAECHIKFTGRPAGHTSWATRHGRAACVMKKGGVPILPGQRGLESSRGEALKIANEK